MQPAWSSSLLKQPESSPKQEQKDSQVIVQPSTRASLSSKRVAMLANLMSFDPNERRQQRLDCLDKHSKSCRDTKRSKHLDKIRKKGVQTSFKPCDKSNDSSSARDVQLLPEFVVLNPEILSVNSQDHEHYAPGGVDATAAAKDDDDFIRKFENEFYEDLKRFEEGDDLSSL